MRSTLKIPRFSPSFHQHPQDLEHHNIHSFLNHSLSPRLAHLVDTQTALQIVHTNCSLPQKHDNCSFVQFEALLNFADRTVCKCDDSRISVGNWCNSGAKRTIQVESNTEPAHPSASHGVTVFAVTPTYTRNTQKVDLTSLCYTVQHVPNLIWIVVEDSTSKTSLVANLLQRCKVRTAVRCV